MTPDDTLPCGHPVACLRIDGECGWCVGVREARRPPNIGVVGGRPPAETTPDTLPCGHPAACLSDGACALCAAVQEVRDALTERDAALRLADQAADDRDRWRAAVARQEGPWLAVEAARLDAAEARLDIAEAALVDAIHAREQAESAIPAGVAVLDRAALAAHVERLREALIAYHRSGRVSTPETLCWCHVRDGDRDEGKHVIHCRRARAALAATPALSLEAHDREVAARALEEAAADGGGMLSEWQSGWLCERARALRESEASPEASAPPAGGNLPPA